MKKLASIYLLSMKKKVNILLILLFIATLLFNGCFYIKPQEKYRDSIKVDSTLHDINFTYDIYHEIGMYRELSFYSIRINQSKELFFDQLKNNEHYLEQYDENTLVLFKNQNDVSAYFTFTFTGISNNLYEYVCQSATAEYITTYNKLVLFDFPYYTEGKSIILRLNKDSIINCSFDYIKQFYEPMDFVVKEKGEDYFIIKSYNDWVYTNIDIRIEKIDENSIKISEA